MSTDNRGHAGVVGRSRQGRPIVAEYFRADDSGAPLALVLCGLHGNEVSSVAFGERIRSRLLAGWAGDLGTDVLVVPVANPDGVAAGTRENARGVDLNRNFPASNFASGGEGGDAPESEPETRAVRRLIDSVRPEAIFAIHCCEPLFDWDGPGRELAETMSHAMPGAFRFPAERLGANPGSLGSWAGRDRGLPVVTVEFDCHGSPDIRRQLDAVERSLGAALRRLDRSTAGAAGRFAEIECDGGTSELESERLAGGGRLEHRAGESGSESLLVVGGMGGGDRRALHVAESLRRRLLHRPTLPQSLAVATRVGGSTDSGVGATGPSARLAELIDRTAPGAVVSVEGGGRADGWASQDLDESALSDATDDLARLEAPESSEAFALCRRRDVPALLFAVAVDHADGRDAGDVPSAGRYVPLIDALLASMESGR